jgi:biotin transport system substrate-specific component
MEHVGIQKKSIILGKLLGILGFAGLLGLSALIKVPLFFTPVPLTLQNFVVFLAGALLGPLAGMAAVLLYVTVGSAMGTLAFFGPTGGYLLGFVAAAGLIGTLRLVVGKRSLSVDFLAMAAGAAVIYLCGGIWLALGYGWTIKQVIAFGVLPFLGGDVIKALVAATTCRRGRP